MMRCKPLLDCYAKGPYPALQGAIKGTDPETYTLPKQHTPSLQGGVVDFCLSKEMINSGISKCGKKYKILAQGFFCMIE
jgi:hypothetical protein